MFYPSPYRGQPVGAQRPVLLIAGTHRVVVGIARSLAQHGLIVDIAEFRTQWQQPIRSKAIRKIHKLPHFDSDPEEFRETMLRLVDSEQYDMLIPTTDEALAAVCRIYDDLAGRVYPGCPSPATVRKALDKVVTLRIARECGLRVPLEYRFGSVEELRRRREEIVFPLVAKAADRGADVTTHVRYLHTFEELEASYREGRLGTDTLLQEYCAGDGVGIEILMWNGRPQVVFQHRRWREYPPSGGVSVLAEAQKPDPGLLDQSIRLLNALSWQGVAMVEFKVDSANGRWWLMEVNGRYWGSLPLALNAGVPFPYCEWMVAHGLTLPAPPAYSAGAKTVWRFGSLQVLLQTIKQWRRNRLSARPLRAAADFLSSLFSLTPDAVWNWNDLRGSIQEYRLFFRASLLKLPLAPPLWKSAQIGRAHGVGVGFQYLCQRFKRALGARRPAPPDLENVREVLFVCAGNIIRSALAEAMLRDLLPKDSSIRVRSAGVLATQGLPADARAATAARQLGFSLGRHRSTPLSEALAHECDLIVVMDDLNRSVLAHRFPAAVPRTHLLAEAFPEAETPSEINDPYDGGMIGVMECAVRIQRHVARMHAAMKEHDRNNADSLKS
jgi:protein-tyrosine-phosphatase/predicted ATP-grasp superfamily ATP-dependent carboligase